MFLNASIPHIYCQLRAEYLYNLEDHYGEFIPVAVFGVASIPSRAVMFHAMTEGGAQIARLPISAFVHRADAPDLPLEVLELWDAFSYDIAVTAYDYMRGLRCRTLLRDTLWRTGEYVMTLDWAGSNYAEDPGEGGHKCAHLLKLDNGCFALQPNNRILWEEPSFITKPIQAPPGYKTNTHVWSVENKGPHWHTADDPAFFYTLVDPRDRTNL